MLHCFCLPENKNEKKNVAGGVKVAMDVGFERVEVNTPMQLGIDYANSQTHVVVIERSNYGKDIKVQVC